MENFIPLYFFPCHSMDRNAMDAPPLKNMSESCFEACFLAVTKYWFSESSF